MNSIAMIDHSTAMAALGRPLVFGDLEQIRAMRLLCPEVPPLVNEEGQRRYRVRITIEGDFTDHVYAADKEEAEEEARELVDDLLSDCDITIKVEAVEEP